MTASINFHGPYEYVPRAYGSGEAQYHSPAYASLGIKDGSNSDVTLYFDTPAQLDALILAAVAAKDLLLAAQPGEPEPWVIAPECARGDHHGCHDDNQEHPCECCLNGHGLIAKTVPHPCGPGACICGATVSSTGKITPAAVAL